MTEPKTISQSSNHGGSEQSTAHALSFIVRIWRQDGLQESECRGWVEHVQTGRRTAFLGLDQLRSVIAEAVGLPLDQERSLRKRLKHLKTFVLNRLSRRQEGGA